MSIQRIDETYPLITLVGRTNVGKSTLFNRLVGEKRAITSAEAGTTRTNNVGMFWWRGEPFRVIDTGGTDFDSVAPLEGEVLKQIQRAIRGSAVVLFLVDLRQGLLPQERRIARMLAHSKKRVVLVGNKSDTKGVRANAYLKEWLALGLGEPFPVSAINGVGVGDLLDHVTARLPHVGESAPSASAITVALIGKPNVGKSSLFNALIGEERAMVSPLPHTTRESHDTLVELDGTRFLFIDTAGMRRKSKIQQATLERESVSHAYTSLASADICLLILNATEAFSNQDQHLAGLIAEKHKGLIIAVNKWDMIQGNTEENKRRFAQELSYQFPFLSYAPVVFMSAKTHQRVHTLYPLIKAVYEARGIQLSQAQLNAFLKKLIHRRLPMKGRGARHPRMFRLTQMGAHPPTFEVTIKQKTSLHDAYLRFIANALREAFGFLGTPVAVYVRKIKNARTI